MIRVSCSALWRIAKVNRCPIHTLFISVTGEERTIEPISLLKRGIRDPTSFAHSYLPRWHFKLLAIGPENRYPMLLSKVGSLALPTVLNIDISIVRIAHDFSNRKVSIYSRNVRTWSNDVLITSRYSARFPLSPTICSKVFLRQSMYSF